MQKRSFNTQREVHGSHALGVSQRLRLNCKIDQNRHCYGWEQLQSVIQDKDYKGKNLWARMSLQGSAVLKSLIKTVVSLISYHLQR